MAAQDDAAGIAALSICESLLLALIAKGVLGPEEARNALDDAAAAHRRQDLPTAQHPRHKAAEHIIEQIATQVDAARPDPGKRA